GVERGRREGTLGLPRAKGKRWVWRIVMGGTSSMSGRDRPAWWLGGATNHEKPTQVSTVVVQKDHLKFLHPHPLVRSLETMGWG
ncbi:unnamed protein product, partial [Discosporangium mesarthrocarpum]